MDQIWPQSTLQQTIKLTTMKLLLFVSLAIAAVSAEPEAKSDPWYGYGYRGYYGYPYRYGYGYYRGKRSADAEPEANAEAEPWYGYRGYGYGYPYRYGYGYRYLGRDPLMLNQKPKLSLGMDIEDIMATADTHTDMDMDTTEARDLPMPNQQLKPTLKLSHGMDMDTPVTMVTHTLMVVTTDTHTATTILERDLLMPNQKPNHVMVMVIHTDMDMDTGVKPFNYYCNEYIKSATQPIISVFSISKLFVVKCRISEINEIL